MSRRSVLSPAPLGPTTATASPEATRRFTSHSAVKWPYPVVTVFRSSMSAQDDLLAEGGLAHLRIIGGLQRSAFSDLLAVIEHHHPVDDAHQSGHDVLDPDD